MVSGSQVGDVEHEAVCLRSWSGTSYRLTELISDRESQVWRATSDRGSDVAIKILSISSGQAAVRSNLEIELVAQAALSWHPNVLAVFDAGSARNGSLFVVTAVASCSLEDVRRTGRLAVGSVSQMFWPIASALWAAHELAIVHGDVKPSNILVLEAGRPALSDFSLASVGTRTSVGLGSPHFMPPEVIEGDPRSAAADVWSLAATVWALTTGVVPFGPVGSPKEIVMARVGQERLVMPFGLDGSASDALDAALDADPRCRPSAAELAQALSRTAEPVEARSEGSDTPNR